ncbi:hypothetical protein AMECASPLE_022574 [Ameca splendens]|uniref:AIG1-type G domain-containing protein n=1 Tax=Ameca splendens TaxID=208324 RepID=A0ABV0Z2P2_9TELE
MVMHTAHDSICESADNKADNCLYNNAWMKIAGPAAGPLGDVFLGSSVVVQSEITVAGRGKKQVKAHKKDKANSIQTVEKHSVNVGVYNASMSTPQGQRAERVKPQTVGASKIIIKRPDGAQTCIKVLRAYRIVLLGEKGAGKSTLGNTIFGETVFNPGRTTIQSKSAHERRITVLETPGFSNADQPEGELKDEMARCTSRFTPGPHVFLIVLNVGKSHEEQLAVFDKVSKCFSEEAFKYAAVVFTHADQLPERMNIEQYIKQKRSLEDLVMKCTGQYLVIDHKCSPGNEKKQMSQLINMIDKIVIDNKGGCYTNKMFQAHKRDKVNTKSGNRTQSNTDNRANSLWINFSGPEGNLVTEAFFGSAVQQRVQGSLKTKETEECPSTTSNEGDYKATYSDPKRTTEKKYTVSESQEISTSIEGEKAVKEGSEPVTESKTEKHQASQEASKAGKQEVPKNFGESEAEPGKAAGAREKNEMTEETAKRGGSGFTGNMLGAVVGGAAIAGVGTLLATSMSQSSATAGITGMAEGVREAVRGVSKAIDGIKPNAGGPTESSGLEQTSGAKCVPADEGGAVTDVGGSAGAEGATAEVRNASQSAVSGRAAGSFTKGVGGAAGMGLVGAAAWPVAWVTKKIKQLIHLYNIIKQNIGIVLLVVAFYTLLLLSFCVRVPMAGTILLSCGVLAMLLIILLLLIAI